MGKIRFFFNFPHKKRFFGKKLVEFVVITVFKHPMHALFFN
jgi:hypothetical protein